MAVEEACFSASVSSACEPSPIARSHLKSTGNAAEITAHPSSRDGPGRRPEFESSCILLLYEPPNLAAIFSCPKFPILYVCVSVFHGQVTATLAITKRRRAAHEGHGVRPGENRTELRARPDRSPRRRKANLETTVSGLERQGAAGDQSTYLALRDLRL
jgi:hypothetical protein